jgi:hypothetical protein
MVWWLHLSTRYTPVSERFFVPMSLFEDRCQDIDLRRCKCIVALVDAEILQTAGITAEA